MSTTIVHFQSKLAMHYPFTKKHGCIHPCYINTERRSKRTMSTAVRSQAFGQDVDSRVNRQTHGFHPDLWENYFIENPSLKRKIEMSEEQIKGRVGELIQQVKLMLEQPDDRVQQMELIYKLQRFGVNYHFEEEIAKALEMISQMASADDGDDLYTVSLRFLILRQNRYDISCSAFDKFKDQNGNLKESLSSDTRGLLALNEAAYLSMPGEGILEKAKDFTKEHLKSMLNLLEPSMAKQVIYSLETPVHRRMRRVDARHFISIYEEDEELRNDPLLELAKLDFHLVQLLHREEIRTFTKWYKEKGIGAKLNFARDRSVEGYFFALGMCYEPKYSSCRFTIARYISLLTFMDDVYDSYTTTDELIQFTDVIKRWDVEAAKHLEDHLKLPFLEMNDIVEDIEKKLAKKGKYNYTNYLKEAIKRGYTMHMQEAIWRDNKYVPPMEEYLPVRSTATLYLCLACVAFLCDGEEATPEILEWLTSNPKMVIALESHCRLLNDVVSYERESKTKHVASAVQCYMKEHNVTLEGAIEKLLEMIEGRWNDFNREYVRQSHLPKILPDIVLNIIRATEATNRDVDRYSDSETLKEDIHLLFNQPITL